MGIERIFKRSCHKRKLIMRNTKGQWILTGKGKAFFGPIHERFEKRKRKMEELKQRLFGRTSPAIATIE